MKRWRNVGIVVFATWFVAQGIVSSAAAQEQRTRPKVGLVLSGGGARGAAHIGVLKVLEQEGIPIDYIAGTSFGAIVGALYALGYSPEEIEGIILTQDWNELFDDSPNRRLAPLVQDKSMRYMTRLDFLGSSPQLPTGILRGQKLAAIVSRYTTDRMIAADYDFDRLRIPFRAVATDILTGRPYVFKQGAMSEALRASISMPAIFTPVEKDDMLLVDGGLSDNLPCDVVKEMGADIIIAVDTTSPLYSRGQMQSLFKILDQSITLLMKRSVEENLKMASLTIRPDLEPYTYGSYGQLREIMKKGELAAQEKREEMLVLFPITDRLSAAPKEVLPRKSTIDSIAFSGLSKVKDREVRKEIHSRPGDLVDPTILASDLERLYALRPFDAVTYSTERVAEDRHRLTYRFKEAAARTIGASLRYDQDYKFVVLGEFNARTLFGTPSSATLSGQFGGLENHSASLRLVHPRFSNVFLEPSIHLQKQERYDVRGGNLMDTYLDRRVGSQVMFGATFYKRFEASAGYRIEQVKIRGGSAPNRQESGQNLAGVRLRLRRDTLDHQEFARRGMKMDLQLDRRSESYGSSSNHTTVQGDIQRLIPISEESTLQVRASGFFTRGDLPFYARAFVGGQSFAEMASRQFIGFGKDEVAARQFALLGASYRRQVFASPAGFLRRGYVSADYNVIGSSDRKAFMDGYRYQHGAGIGFSMLTPVAPIRVASGWSAGTVKVYVTIGPSF